MRGYAYWERKAGVWRRSGKGLEAKGKAPAWSTEGNAFEASIVDVVQNAKDPDVSEVTTHQSN